mgnify:CR=1 FL=1
MLDDTEEGPDAVRVFLSPSAARAFAERAAIDDAGEGIALLRAEAESRTLRGGCRRLGLAGQVLLERLV